MNESFTLGLAQCRHPGECEGIPFYGRVLAMAETWCRKAVGQGVQLLVFPESLMTRYEAKRTAFLDEAQMLDGPFAQGMDRLAKEHGLWIAYTVNERRASDDSAHPYNTVVLTDNTGKRAGVYRKVHLFDTDFTRESDRMSAGDALFEPVETPFGIVGLSICYDLRFPEVARAAALQGCQLLLCPAAWVDGPHKVHHWKTLLAARAIENEMFVAGVSRCDDGYVGNSCIFDPLGNVLASAGGEEELLVARVDLGLMEKTRASMPVFKHRKPKLYV